jgi:hypothetical protein
LNFHFTEFYEVCIAAVHYPKVFSPLPTLTAT